MVRFATVAAVLALMAAPLVAQESTEQLRKELESLRKEVDGLKAGAQYTSQEVPGSAKVAPGSMAPDGDSPVMTLLKGTKLSGHVDAGYVVSFNGMHNAPGNESVNADAVRAFDQKDNSFYLNAVQLNLENLASKDRIVGYHLELAAGNDVQVYEGSPVGLQEGWVQFWMPVVQGLDIRVGKMATLVGYEVIESQLDNQYSRGLLFTKLQNFTQTGVRAALSIGDKLTATLGFSNGPNFGVDHFADNDHGKMVEMQLGVKVTPDLFVNGTLLIGNDTEAISVGGAPGDKFYVFDITAGWTLDKLVLGLNLDFVSAQLAGGTRAPGAGIAMYAKYNMTDSFAPSIRVEYMNDQEGNAGIGVPGEGGDGAKVVEFTLTGEFKIASLAIFRIELRHDASNDHIFFRDGNAAKGNTTLGFETILPF